ncbi:MAG: hypothetical protein OEW44_02360 [Gemmatimonadota bacterium]|nr:hypothetical protein [Gemmatimonadota bacterium]
MPATIGWDSVDSDYWIWTTLVDMERVVSAVAYYRITGQPASIVPDVVTRLGHKVLHVNVPQQALPNGTEVGFYMDLTMDDATVERVPASGYLSVIVYR